HLIVDPDGDLCACGNHGCLEAMASGSTLGRLGREAAAADPGGRLADLAAEAGGQVTGEVVFAAATEGDKAALALFERVGHWLGVGIASLVTIFDPDLVVVGGGGGAHGDPLLTPAPTRPGSPPPPGPGPATDGPPPPPGADPAPVHRAARGGPGGGGRRQAAGVRRGVRVRPPVAAGGPGTAGAGVLDAAGGGGGGDPRGTGGVRGTQRGCPGESGLPGRDAGDQGRVAV